MEHILSRTVRRTAASARSMTRSKGTYRPFTCIFCEASTRSHKQTRLIPIIQTRPFTQQQTRQYAAPSQEPAEISSGEYHEQSDLYIDKLVEVLEEVAEERADVDVEYHSGVLTLVFPPAGTYVINKQPPNRQIWLSSPVSGPKRYDYVVEDNGKGDWIYLRDGTTLTELLNEELKLDFETPEGD